MGTQNKRGETASPRTRGWTPGGLPANGIRDGFPAHAGMDPLMPREKQGYPWLPRARGDGPSMPNSASDRPGASPRTRGWTLDIRIAADFADGFPAHAGMDLRATPSLDWLLRLPRARGDGPWEYWGHYHASEASPRTRGWTLARA